MKLSNNLRQTALSIHGAMQAITENPKIKSEAECKKQLLATWKTFFAKCKQDSESAYEQMVIHAYGNAITSQTMKTLDVEQACLLMVAVLNKMMKYKDGDFNE